VRALSTALLTLVGASLATACVPEATCVQTTSTCSPDQEVANVAASVLDCGTWAQANGQVIDPNRAAETCGVSHFQGTDAFIVRYEDRGLDGSANGTAVYRPISGQPQLFAIIYQRSTAHSEASLRACQNPNLVTVLDAQHIHCDYAAGDANILCNYVAGCE
jgi:hypothetical protein